MISRLIWIGLFLSLSVTALWAFITRSPLKKKGKTEDKDLERLKALNGAAKRDAR